jgi:hypothetical protein
MRALLAFLIPPAFVAALYASAVYQTLDFAARALSVAN